VEPRVKESSIQQFEEESNHFSKQLRNSVHAVILFTVKIPTAFRIEYSSYNIDFNV